MVPSNLSHFNEIVVQVNMQCDLAIYLDDNNDDVLRIITL